MSSNGNHGVVAITCIEDSCIKKGVRFYNGKMCPACGGEMYPMEEIPHMLDDSAEFSNDMLERLSGKAFIDGHTKFSPRVVHHDDTFHCAPDLKGCPIAKKAKCSIPIDLYNKWIYLAGQLQTEWIAYLKGHKVEGEEDSYEITGMYFPKQKATAAHVSVIDDPLQIQEGTIAAVHSHVGMNAFFSGEDEAHFNHQIELVVNNKGDIKGIARTKLECGRDHRGEADLVFSGCDEEIALEEELRAQLTEQKYSTQFTAGVSKDYHNDTLFEVL